MKLMKKSVLMLAMALSSLPVVAADEPLKLVIIAPVYKENEVKNKKDNVVVLEASNTLVLTGVIDDANVNLLIQEATEKSYKLPEGAPMYLYVNSPGGSIIAGSHLITALKGLGREVKTITSFGASMAFMTVQSLGERLITQDGVLMSHRAKGEVKGQFPGELDTELAFWRRYVKKLDMVAAKRMGLTVEELEKKHYDEYWTEGSDAVEDKAADRITNVRCGKSLQATKQADAQIFIFTVTVTTSTCPLIEGPLKIEMKKAGVVVSQIDDEKVKNYVDALLYDKQLFVKEYIVTGKYENFINHK